MSDPKVSSATWSAFCGAPTISAPSARPAAAIAVVRVTPAESSFIDFHSTIAATTTNPMPTHWP